MQTYRIYRAEDIPTVLTDRLYVSMSLDPDGVLRCIGTGDSPNEIALAALNGHLGAEILDPQGRQYIELFAGYPE